jgi:hypothetical protein
MSFSLQGLERVNGGLAFAATLWSYTTADDIASVEASDYFAEAKTFKVGDCILAVASDAAKFYRVMSLAPVMIEVIDVGDTANDPFTNPRTYANFAALPDVAANNNKCAIVLSGQGVWMINYKAAGLYYSNGVTWVYEGDYELTDTAGEIAFTPAGSVSATDVQAAIEELDGDIGGLAPMTTLGDIIYGGASGVPTRLPGNVAGAQMFLASAGDGADSSAPFWSPIPYLGVLVYYFTNTASDVATYYKETADGLLTTQTISSSGVTDGQLLATFVSEPSHPNRDFIPDGEYSCHIHAAKPSGTKASQIRAEVWEVNSSGVDVAKIADLGPSSVLTVGVSEVFIGGSVARYNLASDTSRLATKVYAVVSGGGSAPTIDISVGNGTDSRTNFPAPIIDATNYVPYTGAVSDVNLGSKALSTTGIVTTGPLKLPAGTATANTQPIEITSGTLLTSPEAGSIEYDGKALYATPTATARGISPAMFFIRNSADFLQSDVNTAQDVFEAARNSITLESDTTYFFKGLYVITRAAGTTAHTTGTLFAGTATFTSFFYETDASTLGGAGTNTVTRAWSSDPTTVRVASNSSSSGTEHLKMKVEGVMSVNAGGTFIPQFQFSAAPGGAPTVVKNSYFQWYAVGNGTVAQVGAAS